MNALSVGLPGQMEPSVTWFQYTSFTRKLKELLDAGAIGELVSLQRVEPMEILPASTPLRIPLQSRVVENYRAYFETAREMQQ